MLSSVGIGTGPNGPINQLHGSFGGMRVIVDANVLEKTEVRLFPESRHRSKRTLKKLIKRFGGEYRKVPAIFKSGDTIFMHPEQYQRFEREIAQRFVN